MSSPPAWAPEPEKGNFQKFPENFRYASQQGQGQAPVGHEQPQCGHPTQKREIFRNLREVRKFSIKSRKFQKLSDKQVSRGRGRHL
jgi:hypothetical protein